MKQKIYVIFDKVAKEGSQLMLAKNDDVASRVFKNALMRELKNGAKSDDYQLLCVGIYDTEKPCVYNQELVTENGEKVYKDCNYIVAVDFGGSNE